MIRVFSGKIVQSYIILSLKVCPCRTKLKLSAIFVWLLREQKPQAVDIEFACQSLQKCSFTSLVLQRYFRKRDKAERRAPHRKWPLPANQGPLRGGASRARRSVTLPCVISTFLTCACVYTLVMIALLSNLAGTNVITMY